MALQVKLSSSTYHTARVQKISKIEVHRVIPNPSHVTHDITKHNHFGDSMQYLGEMDCNRTVFNLQIYSLYLL